LLANLNGFDPAKDLVAAEDMIELDRWAVDRAHLLQQEIQEAYKSYQFHLIYQKIYNFCGGDMGSFYLDIIKDRQYTTRQESLAHRSCQTAMYHIIEAMARWLAPILSFTAEEIWQRMPGERGETIFTETWYQGLFELDQGDAFDRTFWDSVLMARTAVGKQLEQLRIDGAIGSSLDAEVDLYCSDELLSLLGKLGDELRFVLIVSYVRVYPLAEKPVEAVDTDVAGLSMTVKASDHSKCVRCWHHREDVGSNADHPELCSRCVDNVDASGETRNFA
ncbi:MAG: class I tRNA ligase family protein, partial [Sedimenticolaceae bacterium]